MYGIWQMRLTVLLHHWKKIVPLVLYRYNKINRFSIHITSGQWSLFPFTLLDGVKGYDELYRAADELSAYGRFVLIEWLMSIGTR